MSTGSIHMNGTITIAVAKEIENNQKLSGTYKGSDFKESPTKTVSQTKKYQGDSVETSQIISTPAVTPPLNTSARKRGSNTPVEPAVISGQVVPPKRRKIGRNDGSGEDNRNDYFCWLCHKEGTVVCCELCPRVYHSKCLELGSNLPQDWVCPECEKIMRAECIDTRSKAMSMITLDTLCTLLKYALERMKHQGCNPFEKPVDTASVAHYTDYIFNPMDLSQLERNIKKKMYGCTEAFLADAKWILHNCIIFNGTHHKLTSSAKMIIKICKHEMSEIELCPDCYLNSCIRKNDEWFSETCRTPHPLVWAKLKGYPFWPAKALREVDGQVDVRFFGAHDRSWVPTSAVFLLCKDIPTPIKKGRGGFENAMDELEKHIEKLSAKFGKYEFAPFRTPYDQRNVYAHVKLKSKTMKRLNRKQKLGTQKTKTDVKVQYGLNKLGGRVLGQSERQSVVSKTAFAVKNKYMSVDSKQGEKTTATKTASAVKNKYNSIITTRRSLMRSNSESSSSNNSSPVKKMVLISMSTVDDKKVITSIKECKSESDENAGIVLTPSELSGNKKDSDISETKCVKISKSDIVDKIKQKMDLISDDENVMEEDNHVTDNNQSDSFKTEDRVIQRETTPDNTVTSEKSVLQQASLSKSSDIFSIVHSSLVKESGAKISKSGLENQELSDSKLTSVKDEYVSDQEKTTVRDSSSPSPSKKKYLENLQKTIESCKNKLGIVGENDQIGDDIEDEVDDDDDEDDNDEDDDEKMSDDGNEKTDDKKDEVVKNKENDTDYLKMSESTQKEAEVSMSSKESVDKDVSKEIDNITEKSKTEESSERTKSPETNTKSDIMQKASDSLIISYQVLRILQIKVLKNLMLQRKQTTKAESKI
ncbi:hypothetical protein KUTeg_000314 [Tegillarca granosa]|uniref:Protein kinase C-binding protein 1 n=1 Tax=Tegillarca granosa TaxID=220873 RepID=A0ABQ9FX72_TEGGR|nr:hypothetical protein KUTeg_000314 [Tegillarca granosa]